MYFTIKISQENIIFNNLNIKNFFLTFPEIEIVEQTIGSTIIQEYYYLSSQNIRKFKLLNINNNNYYRNKIIDLFKILYDKNLINNYGNEKPTVTGYYYSGTDSRYIQNLRTLRIQKNNKEI
jgi:hypothetical protein